MFHQSTQSVFLFLAVQAPVLRHRGLRINVGIVSNIIVSSTIGIFWCIQLTEVYHTTIPLP